MNDATFRRDFFRRLNDAALEPSDERYVRIYDDRRISADDPVAMMQTTIEWTIETSVQLFSGFRGTGKSTELLRLRQRLRDEGYLVLLFDAEDYLNLSIPVDVPDFLLAVAGAVGETAMKEGLLPDDPAKFSYWERFREFVKKIKVSELSAEVNAGPAKLGAKANLRSDPDFTRMLQQRMTGHLGSFVDDVKTYLYDISMELRTRHPDAPGVVLIVDSIEHIRGISTNAEDVQRSIESLFAVHASKLHLRGFHAVYTVPPWLKVLFPGLSSLYEPGGVQVLPTLKVSGRDGAVPFEPGLEIMQKVVAGRGDWRRLCTEDQLRRVCLHAGGHLRDLLRILADLVRRATSLPVTDETVDRTLAAARNEFLPIADDDARWLAQIAADNTVALPDVDRLPTLARFLDTHLVLCYRNGQEWYNVHPLIRDEVLRKAAPGS